MPALACPRLDFSHVSASGIPSQARSFVEKASTDRTAQAAALGKMHVHKICVARNLRVEVREMGLDAIGRRQKDPFGAAAHYEST